MNCSAKASSLGQIHASAPPDEQAWPRKSKAVKSPLALPKSMISKRSPTARILRCTKIEEADSERAVELSEPANAQQAVSYGADRVEIFASACEREVSADRELPDRIVRVSARNNSCAGHVTGHHAQTIQCPGAVRYAVNGDESTANVRGRGGGALSEAVGAAGHPERRAGGNGDGAFVDNEASTSAHVEHADRAVGEMRRTPTTGAAGYSLSRSCPAL